MRAELKFETEAPSPSRLFGTLPLSRLKITVAFSEPPKLPPHSGSAWRGLLGWEIKSLICPFDRKPECGACVIRDKCPYFLLFEKESALPGLAEIPRGYVVSPDAPDRQGRQSLTVTLVGDCARFLPVVFQALLTGQRRGLGKGRQSYQVSAAEELMPGRAGRPLRFSADGLVEMKGPFPLSDWLADAGAEPPRIVRLSTPVRLRQKGKYLSRMDWPFFFGTLVRRLESLNRLYNDGAPLGRDTWLALRPHFHVNGDLRGVLRWADLERYSNRQRRKVPMGGLAGTVEFTGPNPWLAQWFRAAELVHVGKGAVMGWGKVTVG